MRFPEIMAPLLVIVAAAVVLDWLSGIAKAAKAGQLSSSKMRDGLWHKAGYAFILLCAYLAEWGQLYADLGFAVPLFTPACVYVVISEALSIVENVAEMNPNLAGSRLLALFDTSKSERKGE